MRPLVHGSARPPVSRFQKSLGEREQDQQHEQAWQRQREQSAHERSLATNAPGSLNFSISHLVVAMRWMICQNASCYD